MIPIQKQPRLWSPWATQNNFMPEFKLFLVHHLHPLGLIKEVVDLILTYEDLGLHLTNSSLKQISVCLDFGSLHLHYLLSSWIREGKTLPPLPSASSLCAPSKLLLCRHMEEDFGFAIKILTHPATVSYIQVCWLWGDSALWMSAHAQRWESKWNRFASVMTHTIPIWNTTLSTVRTNWVVEKEQGECFVNFFTK